MNVMICGFLEICTVNDLQNTFKYIPESEFMNYTVMAWLQEHVQLVSKEVKHISNQYYIYHQQVMAWNDPFFEIPGNDPQNIFKTIPEGEFINYTVMDW